MSQPHLSEYGGGVVELLSAAERMHSGDAGAAALRALWEMKQALGPAMASGRLYEDEALLQMPLRAFPGLCMASRQSGLLQAAGLGEAVNYAEHPERTAAIGAAMQGGKLDGWAEMEDTLLLECLPCALHLEPEGTGHVIIPEQTTIPTRSKKRVSVVSWQRWAVIPGLPFLWDRSCPGMQAVRKDRRRHCAPGRFQSFRHRSQAIRPNWSWS
ncbi:MAG: Hsp70 family protein [Lachnospiraceae bacterium]